jgi:outer membrane protein TolC
MRVKPIALALAMLLPTTVTPTWAKTLDFKSCVEATLSQNPNITVSQSRIAQAQHAYNASKASRLPQITLSVTAARSDNALNVFGMKLQQRQASLGDFGFDNNVAAAFGAGNYATEPHDLNYPDAHTDVNTRLEMLIPVWNGGKISAYQKQAKQMVAAAQNGDLATRQYLIYNVYQAYEGVHTARAYIEVAKKAVEAADSYVKTTKNLVEQGVVVRSELLTAKVHRAEALTALEKAKSQEQIALDSLRMLMNEEMPDESLDVGQRIAMTLPYDTMDELLAMALDNNPELSAKQQQVLAQQAAVGAKKADLYPSFNLMAREDWNSDTLSLGENSYTIAGVASWKITDFGVTRNGVDQAQAAANQHKAELASKRNELAFKVKKAWRSLKVAEKQENMNRIAEAQAEEAQRLIMKRYKNGVSTITEVLTAQAQLDKARADLVKSQYEVNVQRAQLRLLTGTMNLASLEVIE